jgi:Ala-tRNA(Pro) deacylase
MIESIVRYLHAARVPFRLASFPSEEPLPRVAYRVPAHAIMVESRVVLIDGRAVLVCFPEGEAIDFAALSAIFAGLATEGTSEELADELRRTETRIPPFGQLLGVPVVIDTRVAQCAVIVFRAFSESDFFEVPFEDYARLEQPQVAAFSSVGELEPASPVH